MSYLWYNLKFCLFFGQFLGFGQFCHVSWNLKTRYGWGSESENILKLLHGQNISLSKAEFSNQVIAKFKIIATILRFICCTDLWRRRLGRINYWLGALTQCAEFWARALFRCSSSDAAVCETTIYFPEWHKGNDLSMALAPQGEEVERGVGAIASLPSIWKHLQYCCRLAW